MARCAVSACAMLAAAGPCMDGQCPVAGAAGTAERAGNGARISVNASHRERSFCTCLPFIALFLTVLCEMCKRCDNGAARGFSRGTNFHTLVAAPAFYLNFVPFTERIPVQADPWQRYSSVKEAKQVVADQIDLPAGYSLRWSVASGCCTCWIMTYPLRLASASSRWLVLPWKSGLSCWVPVPVPRLCGASPHRWWAA